MCSQLHTYVAVVTRAIIYCCMMSLADKDEIFVGKFYPQDKRAEFQHIYKAQYDCMGEGDDEVTLRRGHLILIDFKDHNDWWVGTTQTPDGKFNGKRGFVPRAYLTPAFESL